MATIRYGLFNGKDEIIMKDTKLKVLSDFIDNLPEYFLEPTFRIKIISTFILFSIKQNKPTGFRLYIGDDIYIKERESVIISQLYVDRNLPFSPNIDRLPRPEIISNNIIYTQSPSTNVVHIINLFYPIKITFPLIKKLQLLK